ncbi:terminase small subunit [Rufibacter roseus]|uniref:Terminase small subunit n=1 Tax=Rufibacter roseus TaxID=1567108 RepID=A0ABW2DK54_9BACT|nr:terminase small subunit [Rufibacter roseus]
MAAPKKNKNAVGNEGGRPPIFASPKELQSKIDEYFEYIKGDLKEERETINSKTGATQYILIWNREPEPATITGLALFLGFADRQSLNDYEEKIEFSFMIKKARTRVENGYEKALHAQSPTGAIFALKNMGWNDKQQVEHSGGIITNPKELSDEDLARIAAEG